jgi:thermitase
MYIFNLFTNVLRFLIFSFVFTFFSITIFGQENFVEDEIVIKLKRFQDLRLVAKKYGLHPQPIERFGTRPIYRMKILNNTPPPQLAEEMLDDIRGRIIYAEPNYTLGFPESSGDSWSIGGSSGVYFSQWFKDVIRLPQAHQVTQGEGVKVAVLDTGVSLNHPQLSSRLIPGYDFVDNDTNPSEEGSQPQNAGFGHGTHVAGLVAIVAPQAQIMPVRVLDPNGVGNIWVLAEAIEYAVNPDGNPNTADGVDVINLSLATKRQTNIINEIIDEITCDDDDDFTENIKQLGENTCQNLRDTIVVAGAGNSASDLPEYPAGEQVSGLISVAASTSTDTLASFSNYGSWIKVAAPGENILSTVPPNVFASWSGTSMSTPLVSGQAALIRSQNLQMPSTEIVNRIVSTSDSINASVGLRIDVASSLLIP